MIYSTNIRQNVNENHWKHIFVKYALKDRCTIFVMTEHTQHRAEPLALDWSTVSFISVITLSPHTLITMITIMIESSEEAPVSYYRKAWPPEWWWQKYWLLIFGGRTEKITFLKQCVSEWWCQKYWFIVFICGPFLKMKKNTIFNVWLQSYIDSLLLHWPLGDLESNQ